MSLRTAGTRKVSFSEDNTSTHSVQTSGFPFLGTNPSWEEQLDSNATRCPLSVNRHHAVPKPWRAPRRASLSRTL